MGALGTVIEEARALQNNESSPEARAALRKQAQQLEANIKKAKGNLPLLDAEFIPDTQARIRGWPRKLEIPLSNRRENLLGRNGRKRIEA